MSRSAVFLDEMGVGPLWRLRRSGVAAVEEVVAEEAVAVAVPVAVAEVAPVAEIVIAPVSVPVVAPLIVPPAPVPVPVPVPVAATESDDTAWFDDAPPPPPAKQLTDAEIAVMDWDALAAATAKCTRCDLCKNRKGVVVGRGDRQGAWLMLASSPSRGEEREGRALPGEQGKLLDNMLKAIDIAPETDVYITHLLKCRPLDEAGQERLPTEGETAACRPFFARELALLQPRTIVTLGQMAAAGILPGEKPVRGKVRQLGDAAVVATYHPENLLQDESGKAKARAWGDLCLAKSTHAGRG
ncbi:MULTISPECIES: uracil-DNA glycosylase family protein [unclassified Janthinobacterium]|uniref:uracil-DNA glycosylase n=1 Tax=unclassified Janthinobacterium TaxID=2610881 RepID=UPI00161577C3|nr:MULTISPECIES: uracil-DNA glycosylase [unclassified Janthinobacterium]MBB5366942.1 DNA polymerase [Janthinobacterium sp. K2C7]MBB5380580.1 DNA polymerase [Janthinobacterium sp. K2Li3]MBB5385324.1 DNA polymerase [Janthinobacterium sp. K2E3]